jgi:dephospho-CoA kinase
VAPPLTIGLTGGIGAGKSEALAAFERLGFPVISSDALVHELLQGEEMRELLVGRWGEEVAAGGEIDRTRVGEIVFARPEELAWLETQLHPRVGALIAGWLTELPADTEAAVVEVPLLFESGMEDVFDTTVAVVAAEHLRRERADARGHALVEGREARQLGQDEKAGRADHVVRNDGSIADLERELSGLVARIRNP